MSRRGGEREPRDEQWLAALDQLVEEQGIVEAGERLGKPGCQRRCGDYGCRRHRQGAGGLVSAPPRLSRAGHRGGGARGGAGLRRTRGDGGQVARGVEGTQGGATRSGVASGRTKRAGAGASLDGGVGLTSPPAVAPWREQQLDWRRRALRRLRWRLPHCASGSFERGCARLLWGWMSHRYLLKREDDHDAESRGYQESDLVIECHGSSTT